MLIKVLHKNAQKILPILLVVVGKIIHIATSETVSGILGVFSPSFSCHHELPCVLDHKLVLEKTLGGNDPSPLSRESFSLLQKQTKYNITLCSLQKSKKIALKHTCSPSSVSSTISLMSN